MNVLHKGQGSLAYAFFKAAERDGQTIGGEPFEPGGTGSPILENSPAFIECDVISEVGMGDHTVFVGEVVEVGLKASIDGRPDDTTLWLKDLGENIFYGG